MAWTIDGAMGRAIGVIIGLGAIVPAAILWGVLGTVSTNVPFPAESAVESTIPLLGEAPDQTLPLMFTAPVLLFSALFVLLGVLGILGALLKPDYAVNVRLGGPHFGGGGE